MDDEALIFTGDENFLEMDMVVQYMVKDPSAFLFKISGIYRMLLIWSALRPISQPKNYREK